MEQSTVKITDILDNAAELADKHKDLLLLNVTEKTSRLVSSISVGIILIITGSFIVLFAGLSFAWWISAYTQSAPMGFLVATAVFIVLFAFIWFVGKKFIQQAVINVVIKSVLYDKEH